LTFGFEPTADQQTLVESVRRFAAREMRAGARAADEAGALPATLMQSGWDLSLLPASVPEKYGGFGERSAVTGALFAEELGWGDLSAALALLAPGLVALPVLLAGSEQQKQELLPLFCGERFVAGSAALLEPHFDFDPRNLRTRATPQDGGYVLDGVKCDVPCAAESEWMLVYAALAGRTEAFLLPRGTAGLAVKEREQNLGLHALPLYAVELSDCRIPGSARLGGEQGADVSPLLDASRVALAALAVGVARAAYEYALAYAKERKAFGEPIAQRQAIAFMLAEMATDVEAARLLAWEAAFTLDEGRPATQQAFLAKTFADDMAMQVTDRAVQVLGGHGYIRDYPVEMWMRNARAFAVLEGLAVV
jgi:alkylation response protein AidB-like acyl-CoA dehydrogenase